MEKITIDTILDQFREWIENKQPISPAVWLDGAQKLASLAGDLDDEIAGLKSKIADRKATLIYSEGSVARAKAIAESGEDYKMLLILSAKRERVQEHIRIAKLRTRQDSWGGL